MKTIIIEGMDNTGKNTIIQKLMEKYSVVKIIHSGKPKSKTNEEAQIEQQQTFNNYANEVLNESKMTEAFIFNRAWYGEYVYGCLYRNADEDLVKTMISNCEKNLIHNVNPKDIYFIMLLSSSSDFLMRNDDGLSISNAKKELIEEETKRFKEIFDFSIIPNKHIVYVNDGNQFRSKEDIYNEITKILNKN